MNMQFVVCLTVICTTISSVIYAIIALTYGVI